MQLSLRYTPLLHQAPLHRSSAMYRLMRGGVGSGKTLAGAVEAIRLACCNPRCDGMIVAPTWAVLQRTTLRTFLKRLPRFAIRTHKKSERYIELRNGARIYYASADRPDTLEGANLAWAWGDEGRYWNVEAWNILLARVRDPEARRRSIIVTSTPSMGWLYEVWGNPRPGYESFAAATANNHHLPADFAPSLKAAYSAGLYKQYAEGEWVVVEGAVFPEFRREIHLVAGLADDVQAVHPCIDFGGKHAVVYLDYRRWCDRHGVSGCFHVVGEWMPDQLATYQLPADLKLDLRKRRWQHDTCIVDRAGSAMNYQSGVRDTELLEMGGFCVTYTTELVNTSVRNGIDKIRSLLAPVSGPPRLYFDASLAGSHRGVVSGLEQAAFDKSGTRYAKDGDYDHALDAMRYGIVNLEPVIDLSSRVV